MNIFIFNTIAVRLFPVVDLGKGPGRTGVVSTKAVNLFS